MRLLDDLQIRTIVPYLRGYGPTRFRFPDTLRSGQHAALGQDLIDLLDALDIPEAVVGGYAWGGRAVCVAAALHPDRVTGLATVGGYNIQNSPRSTEPDPPLEESRYWYIHYLRPSADGTASSRIGRELCRLLWLQWSPSWDAADAEFARTAPSFSNPDFVEVVIHSYRRRRLAAEGDRRYDADEAALAAQPAITVPTISLDALADGLGPDDSELDRGRFTGLFHIERLVGIGHNVPQEYPLAFASAVSKLSRV